MRPFQCSQCQNTVFFENSTCERCGAALGFVPAAQQMLAFLPPDAAPIDTTIDATTDAALWTPCGSDAGPPLRPCANRVQHAICNWMIDHGDTHPLCRSCRLTRVIPVLENNPNNDPNSASNSDRNRARWQAIEQAKRRLVFTLLGIGLAPWPKTSADDWQGLDFLLLQDQPGEPPVRTGHEHGTVTLNIAEADDDRRETLRVLMGEPTRTLLGHLRHEAAHYLHYRWIAGTAAETDCRASFGDERTDYATALAQHYANGAPSHWPQQFISAYASAHPWEDWAETCAHYLLVLDAVQTASAWGLSLDGPATAAPALLNPAQPPPVHDLVIRQWLPVAQFLNAMHRSLGQRDSYPYLLPATVLDKMGTVQRLLGQVA